MLYCWITKKCVGGWGPHQMGKLPSVPRERRHGVSLLFFFALCLFIFVPPKYGNFLALAERVNVQKVQQQLPYVTKRHRSSLDLWSVPIQPNEKRTQSSLWERGRQKDGNFFQFLSVHQRKLTNRLPIVDKYKNRFCTTYFCSHSLYYAT